MDFFSNGITGSDVRDPNFRLRFFVIIFMGVMAFGAVLFWRSKLLLSQEYVDIPIAKHLQEKDFYQNIEE